MTTRRLTIPALMAAAMLLAGCASAAGTTGPAATVSADDLLTSGTPATELRLGYFANVTHTPALVGVQEGIFQQDLGDTKLSTQIFSAGPEAIEALSAGAIDAAFLGPSPSINTFIQSAGASARIVAGATTGGASLVVRDGITSAADLKGTTLATPQLGNTQDVALRSWLKDQGYTTDTSGGGDVHITPTDNAQTLTLFQQGQLDGAWLPEPWASRLVVDAGAHVLVDEADLWPDGRFPTTVLLVNADFLAQHPQTVSALVQGDLDAIDWIQTNPTKVAGAVNDALTALTGKPLSDAVLTSALGHVTFSPDPDADAFQTLVDHGVTAGTQKQGSIQGLFDLRLLNRLLAADGQATVSADGLGEDGS